MSDSPRVLLWPRVVARWRLGADWCVPSRVLGVVDRLDSVVEPTVLRGGPATEGVVVVFDTPTSIFLEQVAPLLVDAGRPFVVSVATARIRTRALKRPTDGPAATWRDLEWLVEHGATLAVRGHDALDVARLPDELAFGQLARARQEIRRHLGIDAWVVCDPATSSRRRIGLIARDLGFTAGVVRRNGTVHRDDPLRNPAIVPRPWQSVATIVKSVSGQARASRG